MYRFTTVILLVSALFVPMALGQVTGKISGTVTDESGALIPGVEVLVMNTDTGSTRTLVTGDEGRYMATDLTPGSYSVEASLAGFQTAVRSGLVLSIGREIAVGMTLKG